MITSSFLHLPLLVALAQANWVPRCTPPPPPNFLPNAVDCLKLTVEITKMADMQRDAPQVWSRARVAPGHGVQLPYTFALQDNNCEFLVDTASDNPDIFPTRLIYNAALQVLAMCLLAHIEREPTVGYVLVGPRQKILLYLRRHFEPQIVTGKNNTAIAFNGSELTLMEVGLGNGANLTSAR